MTLREKLCAPIGKFYTETSKELEEIADDYAIEFAKWCLDIGIYTQFKKTQGINKELLEIFKKEKGL